MGKIPNDAPAIEFREVSYKLPNGHPVLSNLNLDINPGETIVLLGRSGSGKTTALKLINHLLVPSSGAVLVNGSAASDGNVIELRRGIGYVIQEAGLFPHYTIEKNIGLVPRIQGWSSEKIARRVEEMLRLVGLDPGIASRYPNGLSGGQRQRVGVARALAADPPILLMDEPFGALDALTRNQLQSEFRSLQKQLHKTVVFVTHDLREALLLGSRIALLEAGSLVLTLTPQEFVRSSNPLAAAYMRAFSDIPVLATSEGGAA